MALFYPQSFVFLPTRTTSIGNVQAQKFADMKIILLIVFLVIGGTSAARMRRITGGEPIPIQDALFYVSVRRDYGHTCGGAFITKNHILTAEQCVADEQGETYPNISVVLAMELQYADTAAREVVILRPPPCVAGAWTREMGVALLALRESLPPYVTVARIPMSLIDWMGAREGIYPMSRMATLIALRDRVAEYEGPFDEPLKQLQVTVNRCNLPNRLCGIASAGETIRGDEGSPLVFNGKVIGVALGRASDIHPLAIYADVYRYINFFFDTLR